LRWSAFASLVEPSAANRLRDQAGRSPATAKRILVRALRLREGLYRIGKAILEDWPLPAADLEVLDHEVREARQRQRLVARAGRVETEWVPEPTLLDPMLGPVALSAAELFASEDLDQLKQCGGTPCGWLFIDTTRNHSRQWCEMADCGNLAKVRRFRQRHQSGRRTR
jgi:predicted RNA-binding Zn ribbon-like protein